MYFFFDADYLYTAHLPPVSIYHIKIRIGSDKEVNFSAITSLKKCCEACDRSSPCRILINEPERIETRIYQIGIYCSKTLIPRAERLCSLEAVSARESGLLRTPLLFTPNFQRRRLQKHREYFVRAHLSECRVFYNTAIH